MKLGVAIVIIVARVVIAGASLIVLRPPVTNPSNSGPQENQPGDLALASDFTPPTGKTTGPGAYGPWNLRLLSATSRTG